jgi:hypothetical protein
MKDLNFLNLFVIQFSQMIDGNTLSSYRGWSSHFIKSLEKSSVIITVQQDYSNLNVILCKNVQTRKWYIRVDFFCF